MPTKKTSQPTKRAPRRKLPEISTLTLKYANTVLAPLRRTEAMAATKLALAAIVQQGTLRTERTRVYGPTLRIEKPKRRGGAPTRIVWVRIRDRDQGVVHEISVANGKILEQIVNEHANPPFSDDERADARRLISSDPVLGKIASRKNIDIEWFSPGDHSLGRGRVIGARLVRSKEHQVVETIAEAEIELDQGVVLHGKRGPK